MNTLLTNMNDIINSGLLGKIVAGAVILAITAIVAHFLTGFLRRSLSRGNDKDLPTGTIFINIGRASVWFLGICIILSTCFKIDVSAAITALGVGGIAISLGLQDTISNLMGGLQLSFMRLIRPGDNIVVGSSSGVVLDMTWRHTSIRTEAGDEIIIPNSVINKTAVSHVAQPNVVVVPFVVVTNGKNIDELSELIARRAAEGAASIGKVEIEPIVLFTEIIDAGFQGKVKLTVAQSCDPIKAKDAVVRAIAPLTRENRND